MLIYHHVPAVAVELVQVVTLIHQQVQPALKVQKV